MSANSSGTVLCLTSQREPDLQLAMEGGIKLQKRKKEKKGAGLKHARGKLCMRVMRLAAWLRGFNVLETAREENAICCLCAWEIKHETRSHISQ